MVGDSASSWGTYRQLPDCHTHSPKTFKYRQANHRRFNKDHDDQQLFQSLQPFADGGHPHPWQRMAGLHKPETHHGG